MPEREKLVEGVDYYLENGLFVLTERYLLRRGYCCQSGCRHCPYGFEKGRAATAPPAASSSPPDIRSERDKQT